MLKRLKTHNYFCALHFETHFRSEKLELLRNSGLSAISPPIIFSHWSPQIASSHAPIPFQSHLITNHFCLLASTLLLLTNQDSQDDVSKTSLCLYVPISSNILAKVFFSFTNYFLSSLWLTICLPHVSEYCTCLSAPSHFQSSFNYCYQLENHSNGFFMLGGHKLPFPI